MQGLAQTSQEREKAPFPVFSYLSNGAMAVPGWYRLVDVSYKSERSLTRGLVGPGCVTCAFIATPWAHHCRVGNFVFPEVRFSV